MQSLSLGTTEESPTCYFTVRISQCIASFEQPWSHSFLGVHKSLWPDCLWGLHYCGAEFRLPRHTALQPRISWCFLQTPVSIPNNMYSAQMYYTRSSSSLFHALPVAFLINLYQPTSQQDCNLDVILATNGTTLPPTHWFWAMYKLDSDNGKSG